MTAEEDRPGPALTGTGPGQSVLLTVRFLTELALIVVLALVGVFASLPLAARIVIGVAAPMLAMVIWGRWVAPRARRRLADPRRLATELVLFATAAAALALAGPVLAAVVFAVVAMGVAILVRAVAPGS